MTAWSNGAPLSYSARAVITGAGSGIGQAIALELIRRGSTVVCSDINGARIEETVALAEKAGGRAEAVVCDVSQRGDMENLARVAEAFFDGPPTLMVNNAGVGAGGRVVGEIGFDEWYWLLGINLLGVVHGCEVFAPHLRAQRRAGLINVASAAAYTAAPLMGPYSASKAAVLSLSETLAAEMSGTGVHVTVVCPTFVKTNVARDGRLAGGSAEFAAKMIEHRGTPPQEIARKSLDANDKGRLYVMPQLDAKLSWRMKRFVPALTTRAMALAARKMDPASVT